MQLPTPRLRPSQTAAILIATTPYYCRYSYGRVALSASSLSHRLERFEVGRSIVGAIGIVESIVKEGGRIGGQMFGALGKRTNGAFGIPLTKSRKITRANSM